MTTDYVEVLIVGAGISGIGAAHYLKKMSPGRSFAIVEARGAIGGTWDLFRYPGIRSDSDMHTLGFAFKPWLAEKSIADGPSILSYLKETVAELDLERHIRFGHKVRRAAWSSDTAEWTVEIEHVDTGELRSIRCNFLAMCSGYYAYDKGFTPDFEGVDDYQGKLVHPQLWPDDLDYSGKRVVVIGSGATAVTLVPALAKQAAHVTMLQRSPTYVVSQPAHDATASRLRKLLPRNLAYSATRWKNVLWQMFFFNLARKRPEQTKARLLDMVREQLGPDYDVATHFTPRYNPWDQRLCLVPDNDLFDALKAGSASVVTDHIERFVPDGLLLKSGERLAADIVVTATGLNLQVLAGMETFVDGKRVEFGREILYKGLMFTGVPNLAMWFGYTNASWTLKADLTAQYVCRVLNRMDATGTRIAVPKAPETPMETEYFVDFSSGYFQRAQDQLPKQGTKAPWRLHQNYARDVMLLRFGKVDDGVMTFGKPTESTQQAA